MTTEQELQHEIAAMWADMRKDGSMVVDTPTRKVGMPWAVPYEGVCFPVEVDGEFVFASIPADQVARFALGLARMVTQSRDIDSECDAEIAAHDAITTKMVRRTLINPQAHPQILRKTITRFDNSRFNHDLPN